MKKAISRKVSSVAAALAAQVVGWKAETVLGRQSMFGDDWEDAGGAYVRFTYEANAAIVVVLNITPNPTGKFDGYMRERAYCGVQVEGDTLLDGGSFIRRGIDVSCCQLISDADKRRADCHQFGTLAELLDDAVTRCEAVQRRRATAVPVPGLPHTVQPAWFDTTAATLRAGKSVSLLPHGMGVGYRLSTCRTHRWDKRADAALETKLGVSPVFVTQLDCD